MKAMILAAGMGRRLAPLTNQTPKPLLPIAGEPLLVRQIRQLSQAGYNDIVINLHHLGVQIETTLGDGSALGRYRGSTSQKLRHGGWLHGHARQRRWSWECDRLDGCQRR